MAFTNAQASRIVIGSLNYSGYATQFAMSRSVDMLETTTLLDTAKTFIPGSADATASLDFLLDSDGAAGDWAQMTAWKSSQPTPLSYAPMGLTTGSLALLMSANESAFNVTSSPSSPVSGNLSAQATGGAETGVVVENLTSIAATGNGTARDGAAASTNGGVAHLHITAWSGVTSSIVTIEHSVDGATAWATLVTFASATAATSERVVVAAGTTVRRYLRVVDTLTGTPVYTRGVFFARR